MKRLIPLCIAALIGAQTAAAQPLCDAFASADQMPSKYRKLAPVISGGATDWIITADQMDAVYDLNGEAAALLALIAAEFQARDTQLAIVMAPPRPLVAGQAELDRLTGGTDFDAAAVTQSYNQMIDTLRSAGVVAPNLLAVATRDDAIRDAFYYRHDTHWTPRGAAESALALAGDVVAANIAAFAGSEIVQPNWTAGDVLSERGSLANMAHAVCGAAVAPVDLPVPVFPTADLGLLEDTSDRPTVLLAGSSFSDRYKRDAYRVADAISGALGADVVNHSVSGGGATGAIEGVVNAGLLQGDHGYDLVVWELPYTEGLRSLGMMRQLLGALRFDANQDATMALALDGSGEMRIDLDGPAPHAFSVHLPGTDLQRIKVDLRFADGKKQTLTLTRKKTVPAELQSDWWAVSMDHLRSDDLASITVRYDPDKVGPQPVFNLY